MGMLTGLALAALALGTMGWAGGGRLSGCSARYSFLQPAPHPQQSPRLIATHCRPGPCGRRRCWGATRSAWSWSWGHTVARPAESTYAGNPVMDDRAIPGDTSPLRTDLPFDLAAWRFLPSNGPCGIGYTSNHRSNTRSGHPFRTPEVRMEARVHDVAKELRKTSKAVMAALTDMGEFVKSPSSTVDATAIRKLREKFGMNHAASYSAAPPPSPRAAADSLFLAPLAKSDLRGEAAEMFGVSPDTLNLRDAVARPGPRPGTRSTARPAVPVTTIQGTKLTFASPRRGRPVSTAEAPNHDADWARHSFTPEQRALWMDGGLRDSQADMAAQCAEFEIDPSMLSLKLSGTTVVQRLQSGESPQQIWARIQEDAEAPRTGHAH